MTDIPLDDIPPMNLEGDADLQSLIGMPALSEDRIIVPEFRFETLSAGVRARCQRELQEPDFQQWSDL